MVVFRTIVTGIDGVVIDMYFTVVVDCDVFTETGSVVTSVVVTGGGTAGAAKPKTPAIQFHISPNIPSVIGCCIAEADAAEAKAVPKSRIATRINERSSKPDFSIRPR